MKRIKYYFLALLLMSFSQYTLADDLSLAFNNTSNLWNNLWDFLYGFSFVAGIALGGMSCMEALSVANAQGGQGKSYTKALLLLIASAMLISSMSYIHTLMSTFSLDSYDASSAGEIFGSNTGVDDTTIKDGVKSLFLFLRFYGFAVTISCLLKLPKIGSREDVTLGKLTIKFVAGIIIMNALSLIDIISNTLGLNISI